MQKILLHTCCAVCSGAIIERLLEENVIPTVFFYNPNIYKKEEYEKRRNDVRAFCAKKEVPFVEGAHEKDAWMMLTHGFNESAERGTRCRICFDMRLRETAHYAEKHGFDSFATTLGISRYKNLEQVNASGNAAALPTVSFLAENWRKNGGQDRMYQLADDEGFYRQDYCGCIYSERNR